MSKTKTFLDANVLMAAYQGEDDLCKKAMRILEDAEREFIVSDYLRLEVLPKPTFYQLTEEVEFMQAFLDTASIQVISNPAITNQAIRLACRYDLHPLDALHAGTALESKADELITLEKPEKPLCIMPPLYPEDETNITMSQKEVTYITFLTKEFMLPTYVKTYFMDNKTIDFYNNASKYVPIDNIQYMHLDTYKKPVLYDSKGIPIKITKKSS